MNLDPRTNRYKEVDATGECSWEVVKVGAVQIYDAEAGALLPLGRVLLRWAFLAADADMDGGLSVGELNQLMEDMRATHRFEDEDDLLDLRDEGDCIDIKHTNNNRCHPCVM